MLLGGKIASDGSLLILDARSALTRSRNLTRPSRCSGVSSSSPKVLAAVFPESACYLSGRAPRTTKNAPNSEKISTTRSASSPLSPTSQMPTISAIERRFLRLPRLARASEVTRSGNKMVKARAIRPQIMLGAKIGHGGIWRASYANAISAAATKWSLSAVIGAVVSPCDRGASAMMLKCFRKALVGASCGSVDSGTDLAKHSACQLRCYRLRSLFGPAASTSPPHRRAIVTNSRERYKHDNGRSACRRVWLSRREPLIAHVHVAREVESRHEARLL